MEVVNNYRKILHPNTYGIIDSNYENLIEPYMSSDSDYIQWGEYINHLIEKPILGE